MTLGVGSGDSTQRGHHMQVKLGGPFPGFYTP